MNNADIIHFMEQTYGVNYSTYQLSIITDSLLEDISEWQHATNIIESFNASLRKNTKNRKIFTTDHAAMKSIYLANMEISRKWQKTLYGWPLIYNQVYIYF